MEVAFALVAEDAASCPEIVEASVASQPFIRFKTARSFLLILAHVARCRGKGSRASNFDSSSLLLVAQACPFSLFSIPVWLSSIWPSPSSSPSQPSPLLSSGAEGGTAGAIPFFSVLCEALFFASCFFVFALSFFFFLLFAFLSCSFAALSSSAES